MTKKEMFTVLKNAIETNDFSAVAASQTEFAEFCAKSIAILDATAEKTRQKARERRENDELTEVILQVLTTDFQCVNDIVARIEGDDVTPSKVVSRLSKLVAAGSAQKKEVVIPATENSKKRTVMGYALA